MSYDINLNEFSKLGRFGIGELIAVRDNIIYTIHDHTIRKDSISLMTSRLNATCTICSDM
jgi:hypothetical protein